MPTTPLRCCPFCASRDLASARAWDGERSTCAVVCLECGASGPKAGDADPPGHGEHLWNQRFGSEN